jgi:hypothetical protein
MGKGFRSMEDTERVKRRFWGLRPWQRHDLILCVAGTIYALVGGAYVIAEPNQGREIALQILLSALPLEFWGCVFIAVGITCVISARWPPFADTWGYVVLTALSLGWGSAYLLGILLGSSPWTNISGVLVWTLLSFMWWAVSGLQNPVRTGVMIHADIGPD